MEESITPTITLGPVTFNLTLLAMTLISVFAVFGFIYWASRKMSIRPKGKQNVLEYAYDFVVGFTKGNIGEHYIKDYSLFLFVLFLFLLVANNIGLMAKIETTNGYNLWTSPTANLGYDFAFSFLITLIAHVEGIRRRGVKEYLKAFVTPGFMTPMNILEELTNFASLALRIFGNIFAGEVLASLLVNFITSSCSIGIHLPLLEAWHGLHFQFSFHVSKPMCLPCCHQSILVRKLMVKSK